MTYEELRGRIRTLLAGRASEQTVFGDISTGDQDLDRIRNPSSLGSWERTETITYKEPSKRIMMIVSHSEAGNSIFFYTNSETD